MKTVPEFGVGKPARSGFTLLELLVVIAIMGLMAALAVPVMKGTRETNAISAATSQLKNDLAFARLRAINERTTVHVIFMPPVTNSPPYLDELSQRGYRLFAERTVGDQPGRPTRRYLTDWVSLPEGVIIPTKKFSASGYQFTVVNTQGQSQDRVVDPFHWSLFPFPDVTSPEYPFPHLSFNDQGGLENLDSTEGAAVLPLLWLKADAASASTAEVSENYHHLVVDALTGRTTVDSPEIE